MKKEEKQTKGLTIVELAVENFMKLKAVRIRPDGSNMVTLTGKNGAGKSSVLNAIMAVVDKAALKKQGISKLLREGAERGFVKVDLGDIIAKLTITEKGEYLTVENKEGMSFNKPAAVMDKLRGMISFDPLAFAKEKDGKKQREVLLGLVDVGLDLDAHEKERARIFEERTAVGRRRDEYEAKLEGLPALPADLPEEEIPLSTISEERRLLQETLDGNGRKRQELTDLRADYEREKVKLAGLQKRDAEIDDEIKRLQAEKEQILSDAHVISSVMEKLADKGATLRAEVNALKDPDFTLLDVLLEEIGRTNEGVREKKRRDEIRAQFQAAAKEYADKTEAIKVLDKKKVDALAAAKFPIEGLGFNADGVTFNGLPLESASDGEKLTVSVAIGMALNPELRVLWFHHGEMLDSDHWAIIEKLAGDQEYQVWAEKMDESGKVGLFIEDGEIRGAETAGEA